jgi:hypothetical protein
MESSELTWSGLEETLDKGQRALLSRRIKDLSLKIEGSYLEGLISRLYNELENAGILFKPKVYLSNGWGCPDGVPVIGIPFYLADKRLTQLEGQLSGSEVETETETMMLLRHEAGHAFNYAYLLYKELKWRQLFGRFDKPYVEDYRPVPFTARFVRHTPGWYGQKHPDEDFAETFAVWLTPGSNWKEIYTGTRALAKLLYVGRLAKEYGSKSPDITSEILDRPVQKMTMTLGAWYRAYRETYSNKITLPHVLDVDLRNLLPADRGVQADEVLRSRKGQLVKLVNGWTGINRHILSSLIEELISRFSASELKIEEREVEERITNIAVFITALAMNYTCRGKFVKE